MTAPSDDHDRPTGRCLCGAVTIEIGAHDPRVSACHCEMCRRWSGAAMWGFDAAAVEMKVTGEVATYASSSFAERAFCPVCGSHLWFREAGDPSCELAPGLFDAAADWPLHREVYADRALACLRLAGDHARIAALDYEAGHSHV